MIEVGIPFSDPVADGPVIQAAAQRALAAGVRVGDCLELIASFRERHPDVPVGILTYANIVVARPGFMREAAEAGADSLLIADVPSIEAEPFTREMEQAGIEPVLIAAAEHPGRDPGSVLQASRKLTLIASAGPASPALTQAVSSTRNSSPARRRGGPTARLRLRNLQARACPRGARGGRQRRHLRFGDRRSRFETGGCRSFVQSMKAVTRNDSVAQ